MDARVRRRPSPASSTLPGRGATTLARKPDGRLTGATAADGTASAFAYPAGDGTGRFTQATRTLPGGRVDATAIDYDGALVTRRESRDAGGIYATHTFAYGDDLRPSSMTVAAGADTVTTALTRDDDGLLTGYGPFTITRNGPVGAPSKIADAALDLALGYDTVGRESTRTLKVAGAQAYALGLVDVTGDRLMSDDLPAPPELLDNRPGATVAQDRRQRDGRARAAAAQRRDRREPVRRPEGRGRRRDARHRVRSAAASRANRVLLGAGRTLDGDVTLEGTVEIGSLVGPISVVAGETLTGPPDLLRTGGDFSGNLRVPGHDELVRRPPGQTGHDHRRAGRDAARRRASRRRRAPSVQLADGHRLPQTGPPPALSRRAPTSRRPRRSARGLTTRPRSSSTAAPRTPAAPKRHSSATRSITNAGTIEKVAGTSPAQVRGRARQRRRRRLARRRAGAWTAIRPRCSRARSRARGRARRSPCVQALFALGPAAEVHGAHRRRRTSPSSRSQQARP